MSAGSSQVTSETIEKTKQQIRGLVGEIAQLSKSDMPAEEFYAAFLQRVVQALAAVGGAMWILGEGRKPQIGYQINLSEKLLDADSEEASKHYKLLDYIVASKTPQLVPPPSGSLIVEAKASTMLAMPSVVTSGVMPMPAMSKPLARPIAPAIRTAAPTP